VSASDAPALRLEGASAAGDGAGVRERLRALTPASADVWALVGLVALAAAIRIVTIDNQSFWMDESLTAYEASLPFGAMLNTVSHVETTPPLFFVLTWLWAKVFGTSEAALRSISTIAGITLVPLAYLSARELFSRRAGVIAAALVALNPFLVWYSQEARSYMLLAALTAAGFLWFVRSLALPSRRRLGWWALFSALALTTHFFAGFIVAPEAVWLLWRHRDRLVVAAVAATAVVQLAMLPFVVTDTGHGADWIIHVSRVHRVITAALELGVSILNRRGTTLEAMVGWVLLLGIVAALLVRSGDRRTRVGAVVAVSVAAFVILAPIALGFLGQDYFLTRNVIAAFVPMAVVLGGAFAAPRARVVGIVATVVLMVLFAFSGYIVQTRAYLERPQWRSVAQTLGATPVPRAVLVAGGSTANPLKIYMPGVNWVQPQRRHVRIQEIDIVGAFKPMSLQPSGQTLFGAAPRVAKGRPLPVAEAPPGTRLVLRMRVHNWVVARFVLERPRRLDVLQLLSMAHRYFSHTPISMLVFMQRPRR